MGIIILMLKTAREREEVRGLSPILPTVTLVNLLVVKSNLLFVLFVCYGIKMQEFKSHSMCMTVLGLYKVLR